MSRTLPPTAAFAGVAAVFAAFFLAAGAPTPLLALRQQEWGFSAGALTLAFAVYALALLVAVLIGGSLSDHVGAARCCRALSSASSRRGSSSSPRPTSRGS